MATKWTAEEIPDLSGRVAIVTGANSGIGYETALQLACKQAMVILACRNLDKGGAAIRQIEQQVPGANIGLMRLDLAELASIRRFAAEFSCL
jgi:NAD(P)-dependent dehydrogenase (short-subunit alcohol dehydrogenase family)